MSRRKFYHSWFDSQKVFRFFQACPQGTEMRCCEAMLPYSIYHIPFVKCYIPYLIVYTMVYNMGSLDPQYFGYSPFLPFMVLVIR